jgi:hypothetical protein
VRMLRETSRDSRHLGRGASGRISFSALQARPYALAEWRRKCGLLARGPWAGRLRVSARAVAHLFRLAERAWLVAAAGGRASRLTRAGGAARESLFGTGNRRTIGSIVEIQGWSWAGAACTIWDVQPLQPG